MKAWARATAWVHMGRPGEGLGKSKGSLGHLHQLHNKLNYFKGRYIKKIPYAPGCHVHARLLCPHGGPPSAIRRTPSTRPAWAAAAGETWLPAHLGLQCEPPRPLPDNT